MKKAALLVSALCLCVTSSFAQTFYPSWNAYVRGGAAHTVGETDFGKLISPAASLGVGRQFTPTFGLRLDFAGPQGKGALCTPNVDYKFNFAQANLDATFDLCNLFGGYKVRTVNPYLAIGIGGIAGLNNDEPQELKADFPTDNLLWEAPMFTTVSRAGIGADFRVNDVVGINLEVACNFNDDHFNSKKGDVIDYHITALAGVKFTFGSGAKKRAAEAAAAEAAAAAAAAKAAADKAAADKAAAERAAAEAAAKAAAEKAAAEKAAAEAAERATVENILFDLDKSDIRASEEGKIEHIVNVLNKYSDLSIKISGYADKNTGTPKHNMKLSEERSKTVRQALTEKGIDAGRISIEYFGSEINPFDTPEANRVAVCVTK